MSEPLDNLNIQIEAEATKAVNELDKLTEKLGNVGGKLTEIAKNPLKIDLSVSGGATKQVDKLAQYADKVAKDMSKHFQEAFNIPNSSMAGIKNLTKQFVDMGITGREGTMKAMSAIESGDLDLANELIRAASAGQEADAVMKSFYDTVKSISKIYISPDMLPTDAWKDMDGLLRQKFTTQPSSGATSIDQYFQEWNEEFPSLFGGLNTDTEQDQFEALTQVVRQCREEIERPLQTQSGEIADGVWQELIEQADVLARKGENAKAVLNDLNIPTVSTENTGFSDLASSLQKISKVSAENLASVGQAIVQMSEGLQSLNGVTFNLAPFEQLAYVAEKLNKIPTVSTATLENVTLIGQALKGLSGVQLDGIGGITADLAELSRGLRDLGKNPVDGIKEIQNAAKPLSEVRAELDEQFKDLGKDWDFTGNIQTKIQSLQNSLAEATSKAQSLETSGKFSGKGYADAVRQINEYTNKIAVLEDKLKPLNEGELNPDVQIRLNGGDTTRSIEDFEATYTELKTLLEGGYSVKPAIVNTINELIDELPEADAEINKFKELLAQANEAAQGSNTSPKFQFDTSQFEQATSAVEDFEQRLENIKPMDFSGSMFELEKFVADLNAKRAQLEQKSSDLDILGVGVDTQRVQQVQLSLERINKTLEIYEEKLNEARAAGELDIKIAPLDTGALDEAENKIVGFGEIFHRFTIPTEQFYEIQDEMDAVKEKYDALADTINSKAQDTQFYGTTKDYANKMAELESLRQEYERLKAEQDGLGNLSISDKAATVFGKFGTAGEVASGAMETFKQKLSAVQGTLKKFESFCSKVVSAVKKFGSAIKKVIAPTSSAKKSVDKFSLSNNGLAKALTKTVKMLKLMVVRMALRGVIDGVKTGFENLAQYSEEVNANMSLLMNSLNQTKNAFAAMVSPIFNVVAPALNYLIQMLITASNCINQLFSALTGNSTWTKATLLTEDYAESVSDAAAATDDLYSTTLGIDELNINSGDTPSSGSGSSSGTDASDMFTTEEVESEYIDFADKIKSIIDDLFSTLKSAWDTEGLYVMDSWKNALNSIWELIKSIGSDFLEVWKQPATVEIFEDILAIIGDIGQSIANLADGFREAWEENDTGLHILENIRDCIGKIIKNIREAADYTVEWTKELDFSPLLQSFEEFTKSLIPVVDNISGALTDFYTDVLLPISKWTIEKGLPEFLDVLTNFNSKVNWAKLRNNLKTLWEHLEPFAETVGEGLILFIERVSDLVANFLNSDALTSFLEYLGNWMDTVDAEDVANAIQLFVTALLALKGAIAVFTGLETLASLTERILNLGSAISGWGSTIISWASKLINPYTLAATAVAGLAAAVIKMENDGIKKAAEEWETEQIERYGDTLDNIVQKSKDVSEALSEASDARMAVVDGVAEEDIPYLEELARRYEELSAQSSLTGDEMLELKSVSDELIELVPELSQWYNDENGYLEIQADELNDIIEAKEKSMLLNAIEEQYTEALKGSIEAEKQLKEDTEKLEQAEARLAEIQGEINEAQDQFSNANLAPLQEEYAEAYEEVETLNGAFQDTLETYNKTQDELGYYRGLYTTTLEEYSQTAQGIVADTTDAMAEINNAALFNADEYYGNMTDILNPEEIRATGLEYGTAGGEGIGEGFESTTETTAEYAQRIGAAAQEALSDPEGWNSIGEEAAQGFADGIENSADTAAGAGEVLGTAAVDSTKETLDINSPSRVFAEIGENTVLGFNEGISENTELSVEAMTLYAQTLTDAFTAAFTEAFGLAFEEWSLTISETFTETFTVISETFSLSWYDIGTAAMSGFALSIEENMPVLTETIADAMTAVTDAAKDTLGIKTKGEKAGISQVFTDIAEGSTTGFNTGIEEQTEATVEVITTYMDTTVETLEPIIDSFYDIGVRAMQGLLNGLASMESAVYAKARSIAENVASTISAALEIHSPSRVMFAIGEFTMEGFGNGMESLYSSIVDATEAFSYKVVDAASLTPENIYGDISSYQSDFNGVSYADMALDNSTNTQDNSAVVSLLTELVGYAREGRNISVEIDGRELVSAYDTRKARSGFAFS